MHTDMHIQGKLLTPQHGSPAVAADKTTKHSWLAWGVACVALLLVSAAVVAQTFAHRAMTVLVPFSAGSVTDAHARDFAQLLSEAIGQPVVVDNRAGAEGTIAALALLSAAPDGHTLLFTSSSIPVLEPVMKKSLRYDPVQDFTPICTTGRASNVMHLTGAHAIQSVWALIRAAKAQPGAFTFAYSSASTRLAGELFQRAAGVKFTGIPYKTASVAMIDIAAGRVDLIFIDDVSADPFYQNKGLRPLAVAGEQRIPALPDTPSAVEIGIPDYQIAPWFGVYASAKTPPEVVAQLRTTMQQAMQTPTAQQNQAKRLLPMLVCGEDMRKLQQEEIDFWRVVIQQAGIEPV